MRRRGCDFDPDEIDQSRLGAATPAPGYPKRAVRKSKHPIGFCIDPEAYHPKQRKRRKRVSKIAGG